MTNDPRFRPWPIIWLEDPNKEYPVVRLDDPTYATALSAFAINCVDVVAYNDAAKCIYLVERAVYPAKHLWWFGGRLCTGESYQDCAVRTLLREIGTAVDPNRLGYLGEERFVWATRKQEPIDGGSDTTSHICAIELAAEELYEIEKRLDPEEYVAHSLEPFTRKQLEDEHVHPVIIATYGKLFPV